mmetsp:Transcript_24771/g.59733  ORF Transcript_24771/g.59733 Transcript_24771/m.59733 type:complete len:315 (+) Transcript_24771:140-1084(+)
MNPSVNDCLSKDTIASAESLSAMMQMEQTTYTCSDYLNRPSPDNIIVIESDRLKIVDWCYAIIDQCNFDRETVAIAVDIIDRFLSKPSVIARDALADRKKYQLLAISALYIAIKTNELMAVGSDFFAAMSQGVYSVEDIETMEMSILEGLSWRICTPTSIQMAYCILSIALPVVDLQESVRGFILDEVRYQTEYSLREYYFATKRPSTVAMAAIFNALDLIGEQDREAVLRALLLVMNDEFESIEDFLLARNVLLSVVIDDGSTEEDTIAPHDCETSRTPDSFSLGGEGNYCVTRSVSVVSPRSTGSVTTAHTT